MSLTVLSEIIAIAGIIDYGELLLLLYLGTHVLTVRRASYQEEQYVIRT